MSVRMKMFWAGTILFFIVPIFAINTLELQNSISAFSIKIILYSAMLSYFICTANSLAVFSKKIIISSCAILLILLFAINELNQKFGFTYLIIWLYILIDSGLHKSRRSSDN